jgi:hypothetical protein
MAAKPTPTKRPVSTAPPSARSGGAPTLRPLSNRPKLDAVMDAVSSVELTETAAWSDLDSLSTHTHIVDIDAVPEWIFRVGGDGFTAVATVYVDLNYGVRDDAFSTPDSFPAEVKGHFDPNGKAIVDAVSIDTSSFYG